MRETEVKRLRGKSAIQAAHDGITGDDELRLESIISSMYGVDLEEAADIHASYHSERIFSLLSQQARNHGMPERELAKKAADLDIIGVARQVAKGKLAEPAAAELLFRQVALSEARGSPDDRYIRFYG